MPLVSTNLYSGKNRTAVIDGHINITNRGPLEAIPNTEIFERPGVVHTLKFLILSDTGCTNSTNSDSLFQYFTPWPSCIGSRNITVNNFGGKTGAAVNLYKFNSLTQQGKKPIIIESVEKTHFSETRDWTAQELNRILHINRVPPWGRMLVTPASNDIQKTYMLLGLNYSSLFTEAIKWEEIGGTPHFAAPS